MISIVIPVYNVASYLDECIQSVVDQSYADWECILIDDGSFDGSEYICDNWGRKDPRIRVFHQENRGVSAARNKGLELTNGDYVTFIDSDDWVDRDFLLSLFCSITQKNTDLAVGQLISHYSHGMIVDEKDSFEEIAFSIDKQHIEQFISLNRRHMLYGPCVKLYRLSIIRDYHIIFPVGKSYGEDLIFNYDYLAYASSIVSTPKAIYHYRRVGSNSSLSTILRVDQFNIEYEQWKVLREFYGRKSMLVHDSKVLLYQRLWGIVYDGIFMLPHFPNLSNLYVKRILAIPEITELKKYKDCFKCSEWIKQAILHRCVIPFRVYFLFASK